MAEFKEGDQCFYHTSPGIVAEGSILNCHKDGKYSLNENNMEYPGDDLCATREEAEEAISAEGKRFVGCLEEARRVYRSEFCTLSDETTEFYRSEMLKVALKLYDSGSE